MTEKRIGELISEIHKKFPSLRFGQMMFAVIAPIHNHQPLTHDELDMKVAHTMFYIDDETLREMFEKFIAGHK